MATDTSKITGAADELSAGLTKGGTAAKTLGAEIASALMALDGRVTALETDVPVTPPIEPPIEPPIGGGTPLPPLTASGSITVGANNQVIENKKITGRITANGKSGVTIRNCIVEHPGGIGIEIVNCPNMLVQDVRLLNTNHSTGQTPNPDRAKHMQISGTGPVTLTRVTGFDGAIVFYAIQCQHKITATFIEGHNMRSPEDVWGGNLFQFNQCTGGCLVEDFSCENEKNNSRSGDNINMWGCSGSYIIRRGLIDGNNNPQGVGCIVEGTSGALFEDIDMLHMGCGGPTAYSGYGGSDTSRNTTFRRVRIKDTIQADQGRGVPSSNYLTYSSSSGTVNTRFEACQHFNVKDDNLAYDQSTMTLKDWKKADFTPRAPIRNRTPGT